MLKDAMWYNYATALQTALLQAKDEGKDISKVEKEVKATSIDCSYTYEEDQIVGKLLDQIDALPVQENYPYEEPSMLDEIHKLQMPNAVIKRACDREELLNKIHGAWIGRVSGCILGKPVENWKWEMIKKVAEAGNNYPMADYIDGNVDVEYDDFLTKECLAAGCFKNTLNGFAPEDDDTNYTVIALKIVNTYGRDFTSEDVAEAWLQNFPVLHLCTAELAGYRNILNHILPPKSASYRNPFKEWIGAQIRGDFFGYINPGEPFIAADMAYRDACITHVKNGIYGEMMIAAMIAQAAVTDDLLEIVQTGLAVIPHTSRLHEEICNVLDWYQSGIQYWDAVMKVLDRYNRDWAHHAVHTIPNAMLVVIALLYGEKDFTKTLSNAVMPGLDTDCNGATVGSIIGIMLGRNQIDPKWMSQFDDTLHTGISGYQSVRISEMAKQTLQYIP